MALCTFEIQHPSLIRARIDVDGKVSIDQDNLDGVFTFNLTVDAKTTIAIWFWPWGITPYLRINNHLINYGIMNINQYDHQLVFDIDNDWLDSYRDNLIQGRIDSLFENTAFNQKLYESAIGYNIDHTEIISKIKKKINE